MIKTFTKDDVIRFVYDEIDEDERLGFEETLQVDVNLRACFDLISETKSTLEDFTVKASKDVISRILYASRNLQSS